MTRTTRPAGDGDRLARRGTSGAASPKAPRPSGVAPRAECRWVRRVRARRAAMGAVRRIAGRTVGAVSRAFNGIPPIRHAGLERDCAGAGRGAL